MLFHETQYLRKPWLFILMAASWLVTASVLYIAGAPVAAQVGMVVLFFGLMGSFYVLRFEVAVREDAIVLTFFPFFTQRVIPFETIASIKVHPVSPLVDYGGWGYRIMPLFDGRAYIMEGNMGATLVLKPKRRKVAFTLKNSEGFKEALGRSQYHGD